MEVVLWMGAQVLINSMPTKQSGTVVATNIEVVHMMSNDVIKMQKLINYTYIVL